jgi:hypothetical protein
VIKRLSLVRLRRDLSVSDSLKLWLGEHAEVMRSLPGISEYTVDLAREPRACSDWDAVATVRFADEQAYKRFRGPETQSHLLSTRGFADAVDAFLVDEHSIIRQEES